MTNLLERLKTHKAMLLTLAAIVAASFFYYTTRYRSRQEVQQRVQDNIKRLNAQLGNIQSSDTISSQVERSRTRLEEEQRRLTVAKSALRQERRFASLAGSAAVQALNLKLSELAAHSHVRIKQRSPFVWPDEDEAVAAGKPLPKTQLISTSPPAADGPFLDQQMVRELYGQSLQRLEIEAPFTGLREFVERLNELPWPVIIVNLEIHVAHKSAGGLSKPSLKSVLILAM
ncbi:MAG: hypothetical protein CMJ21_00645 [Phycisphaerae bacterium]|nr:hypothetical protein [Phycisphaerae bacterium]